MLILYDKILNTINAATITNPRLLSELMGSIRSESRFFFSAKKFCQFGTLGSSELLIMAMALSDSKSIVRTVSVIITASFFLLFIISIPLI